MRRFVKNIVFQYYVEARFVAETGGKEGDEVERKKEKVCTKEQRRLCLRVMRRMQERILRENEWNERPSAFRVGR